MGPLERKGPPYKLQGVMLMIPFEHLRGLNVFDGFPGVVAFGVPLPLYEILQLFPLPLTLVASDGLDFILFFVVDKVRWGPGIVFSVFFCFNEWG